MTQRFTVREARNRFDPPMTQVELAGKSGFDQTYISLIERGKRVPTDPDTRKRLAKALGLAPSRLQFETPRPKRSVSETKDRVGQAVRPTAVAEGAR